MFKLNDNRSPLEHLDSFMERIEEKYFGIWGWGTPEEEKEQRQKDTRRLLFALYSTANTMQSIGVERVVDIALLAVMFKTEKIPVDGYYQELLSEFFTWIHELMEYEQWKNPTDYILSYSYHMLRRNRMTHQEAAAFASLILERDIAVDTWRIRVDRWRKEQKYSKVERQQARTQARKKAEAKEAEAKEQGEPF